jgi:hypothetical protein
MDKNSINFRHHTLIITILIQFNQVGFSFSFSFNFSRKKFCFSLHNEDKLPLILGWNDFFDAGNLIETIGPKEQVDGCPKRCHYSKDKNEFCLLIEHHRNSIFLISKQLP